MGRPTPVASCALTAVASSFTVISCSSHTHTHTRARTHTHAHTHTCIDEASSKLCDRRTDAADGSLWHFVIPSVSRRTLRNRSVRSNAGVGRRQRRRRKLVATIGGGGHTMIVSPRYQSTTDPSLPTKQELGAAGDRQRPVILCHAFDQQAKT